MYGQGPSLDIPNPEVAFTCGSMSTRAVRFSAAARQAARFTAVVVFPTPPFWLMNAILLVMGLTLPERLDLPVDSRATERLQCAARRGLVNIGAQVVAKGRGRPERTPERRIPPAAPRGSPSGVKDVGGLESRTRAGRGSEAELASGVLAMAGG